MPIVDCDGYLPVLHKHRSALLYAFLPLLVLLDNHGPAVTQIMVASEGKDGRIIYAETSMPQHTAKRARPSWSLRVRWNWSLDLVRTRQCGSVGAVMQLLCIHASIPHNKSGRVAQSGHSAANQRPVRHSKSGDYWSRADYSVKFNR